MNCKVIGIMGGIAAGKSLVASILAEMGAVVVDADALCHELLSEPDVKGELVRQFGDDVIDEAGQVNRAALSDRAFSSETDVQKLNAVLHPRVLPVIRERIAQLRRAPGTRAVALDAALLLECGLDELCDLLLFVEASRQARLARAGKQRHWDEEELARRENRQADIRRKKAKADYTVSNDGSSADLRDEIKGFWNQFVASNRQEVT